MPWITWSSTGLSVSRSCCRPFSGQAIRFCIVSLRLDPYVARDVRQLVDDQRRGVFKPCIRLAAALSLASRPMNLTGPQCTVRVGSCSEIGVI